jgi:hypothetical protein
MYMGERPQRRIFELTAVFVSGCGRLVFSQAGGAGSRLTMLGSVAWHPRPRCPSLPAMKPDQEDNECSTPEPLSFAQVRAELLAVVMTNHLEFTLEQAKEMLREAGF